MYEENKVSQQSEERPYPVRAYGRERPVREPQEEEKPRDFLLRVILTQSALCIVIALVAFAVMKTGGERLENAKQSYWALFSEDMEREELVETFKSVSNFLFKPQNDLAKPETTAPAETTSSPVTTAQSTEAQNAESLDGAGGEDLLYPDKTASFAPLTVSGSFCVPVEYTKVTSAFGYRENPVTGEQGFHGGIDLAAPSGTPISADYRPYIAIAVKFSSRRARTSVAARSSPKSAAPGNPQDRICILKCGLIPFAIIPRGCFSKWCFMLSVCRSKLAFYLPFWSAAFYVSAVMLLSSFPCYFRFSTSAGICCRTAFTASRRRRSGSGFSA